MTDRGVHVALAAFLLVLVVQRVSELVVSARHSRILEARGGREHAPGHYPFIVALHVLFPVALAAEVLVLGARPGPPAPLWLALWLAAQALRYAAIRALGDRWTVRIWTVPGEPRVRRGPYRLLPHPNYLAVALELLAAPMFFGSWRTALATSIANAAVLAVRIRAEERALAGDPPGPIPPRDATSRA